MYFEETEGSHVFNGSRSQSRMLFRLVFRFSFWKGFVSQGPTAENTQPAKTAWRMTASHPHRVKRRQHLFTKHEAKTVPGTVGDMQMDAVCVQRGRGTELDARSADPGWWTLGGCEAVKGRGGWSWPCGAPNPPGTVRGGLACASTEDSPWAVMAI